MWKSLKRLHRSKRKQDYKYSPPRRGGPKKKIDTPLRTLWSWEKIQKSQKLQILRDRNQVLATDDFREKGFFLMTCVSAVKIGSDYSDFGF